MKKRAFIFVTAAIMYALVMLGLAMPALAYAPYPLQPTDTEIVNALNYLTGAQEDDGSIGGLGTSAWVVMALVAAGENPHTWRTAQGNPSIVDYLRNNSDLINPNVATDWERSILAIVAAGEDPTSFGEIDYVAGLKNLWDYENSQMDKVDLLNDDFWGILALLAAGEDPSSEMIQGSAAYIKSKQFIDGGWSFDATPGAESDVDDTAAAIMALVAAGFDPESDQSINWGLLYLMNNQDTDSGGFTGGGWGTPPNVGSTSWAVDAILAVGEDPTGDWTTPAGKDPVDLLLSMQDDTDGFFWYYEGNDASSEWMTACYTSSFG